MTDMKTVGDVYQKITLSPHFISEEDHLDEILRAFRMIEPVHRSLYVLSDQNKLTGLITLTEIFNIYTIRQGIAKAASFSKTDLYDYLSEDTIAGEIMRSPVYVEKSDTLQDAVERMVAENLHELPVVDKNGAVIGDLNAHEILRHTRES